MKFTRIIVAMPKRKGNNVKKPQKKSKISLTAKDKAVLKQYNIKNSYVDITHKNGLFLIACYNMDRIVRKNRNFILWDKFFKYNEDCINDNPKNEQFALYKLKPIYNVYDLIQNTYLFERITNVKRKIISLILSEDEKDDEELIAKHISEIYSKLNDPEFMETDFYKALRILTNRMFMAEEEYKRQKMIDEYYDEYYFGKRSVKYLHYMRETFDLPVPEALWPEDQPIERLIESENHPLAFAEGIPSTSKSVPTRVQNE